MINTLKQQEIDPKITHDFVYLFETESC